MLSDIQVVTVEDFLAQFDLNPFGVSRALRELRDMHPEHFKQSALRAIADLPENPGIRFLSTLVPLDEPILELISSPKAFDLDRARRIVEVMRRIDSQAEAKLLRLVYANPARPLAPPVVDRILDIVDAVSEGPRLVPVLMQIFRSANPHLRARLSLSIGRHHRNKDWLEDRMRDPDPRVRANAVEANWQFRDHTALSIFNMALRDAHHRVIGNGAVGLYYAGEIRCLQVFGGLLGNANPHCRAAGLWAVGHLQDTRFQQWISLSPDEKNMMVRRALVVAHGRLKRALELREEQPKLTLRLIKATRQPLAGEGQHEPQQYRTHLFFEVLSPDGARPMQGLKGIQFQIFENNEAILDYSVHERTSYCKPGTYDLYFEAATRPAQFVEGQSTTVRHLKLVVLAEGAAGEHETFDFGEGEPLNRSLHLPIPARGMHSTSRLPLTLPRPTPAS